jgi:ABC-2 type transport system permease protein
MTFFLVRKLLRDALLPVAIVMALLAAFECLWAKSAQRITTEILPLFHTVSSKGGMDMDTVMKQVFRGPARMMQTMMGGEDVKFESPLDMLVIGFLHPLVQLIFALWAVYQAGSAVAGEIDRGTMELLLSQPIPRYRLILAHLIVNVVTIPLICVCLWAGSALGVYLFGPFVIDYGRFQIPLAFGDAPTPAPQVLDVSATRLLPGLWNVAALLFAVSGLTMWLSARGRSRWTVIGIALATVVAMFAVNLIGQMLEDMAFLRPFTIFYYYQPQRIVLQDVWSVDIGAAWGLTSHLYVNVLAVLFGLGAAGYALALWTFTRRDIPAPL